MTYIIVEESTVAELDLEVDFVDASLLNVNGSTTPLIQKEYYSIVGGLGPAPIDALRQVGHSVPLGVLAKPRAYFDLTHTWISLFLLLSV